MNKCEYEGCGESFESLHDLKNHVKEIHHLILHEVKRETWIVSLPSSRDIR